MTLYVNGEAVDGQRIIDEANKLRPLHDATFADMPQDEREQQLMEWSRENVVEAVLLRQAALRDVGPVEDETVEATLNQMIEQSGGAEQFYARMGLPADQRRRIKEDIAERICLERLIRRITSKVAEPTEKEIRKYYDKNAERFTIPEMVRAAHIVKHLKPIDDPGQFRSEMEAIRSQIGDNTDFGALAAKLSDCPENGGDLGFFARADGTGVRRRGVRAAAGTGERGFSDGVRVSHCQGSGQETTGPLSCRGGPAGHCARVGGAGSAEGDRKVRGRREGKGDDRGKRGVDRRKGYLFALLLDTRRDCPILFIGWRASLMHIARIHVHGEWAAALLE